MTPLPAPPARIAVAMSGGVDSAAVAAWLRDLGYDVIGLTMHLWEGAPLPGQRACCTLDDLHDARRVAQRLGIPHYVVNLMEAFQQGVVDDFIHAYAQGHTPNPCIRCNQELKFRLLLERAIALDADFLATGHYAQRRVDADGHPQLWRGADHAKDQSYFLFTITRAQLARVLFPLGGLTKGETRELASRFGLHVAAKRESQDVCFVPDGDYAAFFARHHPAALTPGEIVHLDGRVLGQHRGLGCYTIGQRKGLGIAAPQPLYVVAIDADRNRLLVGEESALYQDTLLVTAVNWLEQPGADAITARIRYAAEPQPARVEPLPGEQARVRFREPQRAITPGQACVFYQGEQVLGGGWISNENTSSLHLSF